MGLPAAANLVRHLDRWLLRLQSPSARLRHQFDRMASRGLGENMERDHSYFTRMVVAKMDISPEDVILDLACGEGWASRLMAQYLSKSGRVAGIDISEEMIRRARTKCSQLENVTFVRASAERIPCPDKSFTKVLCVASFILFQQDLVLRELFRVMTQGGSLFILTYIYKDRPDWARMVQRLSWEDRTGMSVHAYSAAEYQAMLKETGWECVHTEEMFQEGGTEPDHTRALLISAMRPVAKRKIATNAP
jgi:ubiquinone/menaquinone biosynthesis C-methylase UbiE